MKVSIVIPVYEMKGEGLKFLLKNLQLLSKQTYKEIEIIISDHSVNNEIELACKKFKNLNIAYYKNTNNRGSSSSNFNFGLSKCNGDLIKLLMQDDFLIEPDAISKIVQKFKENNIKWLANGCFYGKDYLKPTGSMIPRYNDNKIKNGRNTISAPSVITISRQAFQYFDEKLIWMMDCDYYKRLYDKFGDPYILEDKIVFISQHDKQISTWLSRSIKIKEEKEIKEKYGSN